MKEFYDPFDCNRQVDESIDDTYNISIDELAARAGYLIKDTYTIGELGWLLSMSVAEISKAIDSGQLICSVTQVKEMRVEDINSWLKEEIWD